MDRIYDRCLVLVSQLFDAFGYRLYIGWELECYLLPFAAIPEGFATGFVDYCTARHLPLYGVEVERGLGQFEFATEPLPALESLAAFEAVRAALGDYAALSGLAPSYHPKPFVDQPGSGLHVHLHLEDAGGVNRFTKDEEYLSPALSDVLGGLLTTLPNIMDCFIPSEAGRVRLQDADHVPRTVSWGTNNRTTALRLPDKRGGTDRHIEHRVAAADAIPERVLEGLLIGVLHGLTHHPDPGPPCHGDARLETYRLPSFYA